MNVLITAIGSFAADIVIKNLKKNGATIIATDIYPKEWIADAYNVDFFYQVPLCSNEKEYLDAMSHICKKHSIDYIMPLTDIEVDLLNTNRDIFEAENVVLCISCENTIKLCRNKKHLAEYIHSNCPSVNTIETKTISDTDIPPYKFPFICKPYDGRSSQGLSVIKSTEGWKAFLAENDMSKYIAQPFIAGSVVTVDVVRCEDTTVCIPRKELLRTLNGAGTSVEVFADERLSQMCSTLAEKLDIKGCVNFEFILTDKGEYFFIECNPRFSGGVEFSCIAGYDCVTNHLKCFTDDKTDNFTLHHRYIIARKYEEYITYKSE